MLIFLLIKSQGRLRRVKTHIQPCKPHTAWGSADYRDYNITTVGEKPESDSLNSWSDTSCTFVR